MFTDPMCGAQIDPTQVDQPVGSVPGGAPETEPRHGTKAYIDGEWVYFCSLECRTRYANR